MLTHRHTVALPSSALPWMLPGHAGCCYYILGIRIRQGEGHWNPYMGQNRVVAYSGGHGAAWGGDSGRTEACRGEGGVGL